MMSRDTSLDTLLELQGTIAVIDEAGHWVKFQVVRSRPRPPSRTAWTMS
jgi:hypothetical protein